MIYFIPAWYAQNEWRENEQIWYARRMQTEMDDTVKQVQLFHRTAKYPYQIVLLGFAPNFRHFLHRQGVFNAPYWSCFDAIGCIRTKKAAVLSFHDFNWPKHIEFIYSYFAVIAKLNGEKFAHVEFGEDGNPILVDLFRGGQLVRRDRYDDRGFIGSTTVYENGAELYESYLDEQGLWKIRRYADGHVEVNPDSAFFLLQRDGRERELPFSRLRYDSLDQVISEVLAAYMAQIPQEDIFCAAMHDRHTAVLAPLLADRKAILSFWTGRPYSADREAVTLLLQQADYLIADSRATLQQVTREMSAVPRRTMEITPYDSRVDFGISLQQHEQKILVPVDHVSEAVFEQIVVETARYMQKNAYARVHLFTRNALYDRQDQLLGRVREILERSGFEPEWARKPQKRKAEFFLEEEDAIPILYYVEQCVEELSVSKCLRLQRIVVDLAPEPDLFLQISCISMGIPQIVRKQTRYIEPGRNGRINQGPKTLAEDIAFYLESLANWNEAMISAYALGERYTSARLAEQWKEVIGEIEHHTSAPAGRE